MTVQNRSLGTARLNRRHFLALASGATVSAILAACGGSSSPTATTVAPTKAATAAAAAATTAPAAAATTAPTTAAPTVAATSAVTGSATAATSASAAAPTRAASSAVATTAASPVAAATSSGPVQKVSVMLDWVPNTNHTGLYVAQERGYFKDQGLSVEILPLAEGSSVEEVVAAGKAQFGISASEPLSKARSEGIPILSIAAIIQHNTSGFASLKKANITRPKDFEGKRYGSFGSDTEKALVTKLMQADGGDVSKVEFVEIGDADFLTLAQKGQVDFAWVFEGWRCRRQVARPRFELPAAHRLAESRPGLLHADLHHQRGMTQKRAISSRSSSPRQARDTTTPSPIRRAGRHPRQGDAGDERGPDPAESGIPRQAVHGGRPALGRSEADRLADLRHLHDRSEVARQALRPSKAFSTAFLPVRSPTPGPFPAGEGVTLLKRLLCHQCRYLERIS